MVIYYNFPGDPQLKTTAGEAEAPEIHIHVNGITLLYPHILAR